MEEYIEKTTCHRETDRRDNNGHGWKINCFVYSYPSTQKRRSEDLDREIVLEHVFYDGLSVHNYGIHKDSIYMNAGKLGTKNTDKDGFSLVLEDIRGLESDTKARLINNLKPEDRALLNRGLEYYDSIRDEKTESMQSQSEGGYSGRNID